MAINLSTSSAGIENLSRTFDLDGNFASEKGQVSGKGGSSFASMLEKSIDQVNLQQVQADTSVKELVAGRTKNIHETMLSIERADMSLKLMMQVRNKLLDAYREIMKMQV